MTVATQERTTRTYKPEDIAAMCDVSVGTVLKWEQRHQMPKALRITSRVVRWPVETIDEWLSNQHANNDTSAPTA